MSAVGPAREAPFKAVFIDKDGTLVEDVPYNVDPALLSFTPHALEGLRLLADAGFLLLLVTNQSGLATGRFSPLEFSLLRTALLARMKAEAGIELAGVYVCPHARAEGCACRKPASGLLLEAACAHDLDLAASWMVGDILDDVEAGQRAGCRSVLLDRGNETEWQVSALRTPDHVCADLLEAARVIVGAPPVRAGTGKPSAPGLPAAGPDPRTLAPVLP